MRKVVESINNALIAFAWVFAVLSASCSKCSTLTHTQIQNQWALRNLLYWCTESLYLSLVYGRILWSEVMAFMGIYRWHVESLNNIYCVCHSAAIVANVLAAMISGTDIWSYIEGKVWFIARSQRLRRASLANNNMYHHVPLQEHAWLLHRAIIIDWHAIKYEVWDWHAVKSGCWPMSFTRQICCLRRLTDSWQRIHPTSEKSYGGPCKYLSALKLHGHLRRPSWRNKCETRLTHFSCLCDEITAPITALLAHSNFVIDLVVVVPHHQHNAARET